MKPLFPLPSLGRLGIRTEDLTPVFSQYDQGCGRGYLLIQRLPTTVLGA